jgi:putative two-component system response regulator
LCEGLAESPRFQDVVTQRFADDLYQSCVLHDIGKVAIPDSILLSCEKFGPEERKIMERHPVVGGRALEEAVKILGEASFLTVGMEVAYYHHEHWDGSGYPFGLKGRGDTAFRTDRGHSRRVRRANREATVQESLFPRGGLLDHRGE